MRLREYVVNGYRNTFGADGQPTTPTAVELWRNHDGPLAMVKAVCDFFPDTRWDRITVDIVDVLHPGDNYGTVLRLDRSAARNWEDAHPVEASQPDLFSAIEVTQ